MAAEILGYAVEPLRSASQECAHLLDVLARCLIAAVADLLDGLGAAHSPVANFDREIVEEAREAEFEPFEPVMHRDEIVINVGIVVISGLRRYRLLELA